jgi:hypothetical protein
MRSSKAVDIRTDHTACYRARMSILVVSNFLSAAGRNRAYSEDLADHLESRGHCIVRTSSEPGRLRRIIDMIQTTWRRRRDYRIALVDVFSGLSFVWACENTVTIFA